MKPGAGVNVTVPLGLTCQVPSGVTRVLPLLMASGLVNTVSPGTSGAEGSPAASSVTAGRVTGVLNGVLSVSSSATGTIGVTVMVIVARASLPLLSVTW